MDFSFPKNEKLKSKKLIEQLYEEGGHLKNFPVKLIYLQVDYSEEDLRAKAMVIVPKKNFKSAVNRNRIKRLLREAYRLNKPHVFNNIEGNYAFAILYLGKEMPDYRLVNEKVKGVFDKLIKKVSHEQPS